MAKGDAVAAITAAGTTVDFQPAAGVEIKITSLHISTTGGHTPSVSLYDGSNSVNIIINGDWMTHLNQNLFISNALYLRFNNTASTRFAYSGMQVNV